MTLEQMTSCLIIYNWQVLKFNFLTMETMKMKDYEISSELLGAIVNSLRKVSGTAGDMLDAQKCLLAIESVVKEAQTKAE
jgi:hypothetical protein